MQTCEALHIVLYHYAGNNPVRFVDPDGRSNNVVVIGEPNGAGQNFEIAGNTWISENIKDTDSLKVFYAKDFNNATDLKDAIKEAFGDKGIDNLAYFGHSYYGGLTTQADDRTRTYRPDADAWIESFNGIKFNTGANIYLFGCNAGNKKVAALENQLCVAQKFANETGATVWGFSSYSFATDEYALGHGERLPTNNDVNSKLPNTTKKAWFVATNGKGLIKFTKQ